MGASILVFVSHSSEDKVSYIEPIVADLEASYINVWIDKKKIVPGENLRKSVFRDGLDKADIALIFFTEKSLKSAWVDREIKHVLREETKKGNQFDLRKLISVFDSKETYEQIAERYPELTDDLLHLMPPEYSRVQLGQLISAIWSKYLELQGGDVEVQRQLLERDRELFQKDQEIAKLKTDLESIKKDSFRVVKEEEFEKNFASGKLAGFIKERSFLLSQPYLENWFKFDPSNAVAFGYVEINEHDLGATRRLRMVLTTEGREFMKWFIIKKEGTAEPILTRPA